MSPAPIDSAPKQPLVRKVAFGGSAVVALTGAIWLAMNVTEKNSIQSRIDSASASGENVVGLSQADYATAKTRLDRNYFASSAVVIVGGVGIVASMLWMWLDPENHVALVPQANGASVVVAW